MGIGLFIQVKLLFAAIVGHSADHFNFFTNPEEWISKRFYEAIADNLLPSISSPKVRARFLLDFMAAQAFMAHSGASLEESMREIDMCVASVLTCLHLNPDHQGFS